MTKVGERPFTVFARLYMALRKTTRGYLVKGIQVGFFQVQVIDSVIKELPRGAVVGVETYAGISRHRLGTVDRMAAAPRCHRPGQLH